MEKLEKEKEKTLELGAELLSLNNAQDVFDREKKELTSKIKIQNQSLKELSEKDTFQTESLNKLTISLRSHEKEVEDLKASKIRMELEKGKITLDFDHEKVELERKYNNTLRDL